MEAAKQVLRERLQLLAAKAGLPVPELVVEPYLSRPAQVKKSPFEVARIVARPSLAEAPQAEQDWYLASCLGWWASPVPRRRRRQGSVVLVLLAVYLSFSYVTRFTSTLHHVPRAERFLAELLLGAAVAIASSVTRRRHQVASDAAGRGVLRSAGQDPAAIARQLFGGKPEPGWFRRLLATEPTPAQQIAAAARDVPAPHRALF